jgi:hypothetical protein
MNRRGFLGICLAAAAAPAIVKASSIMRVNPGVIVQPDLVPVFGKTVLHGYHDPLDEDFYDAARSLSDRIDADMLASSPNDARKVWIDEAAALPRNFTASDLLARQREFDRQLNEAWRQMADNMKLSSRFVGPGFPQFIPPSNKIARR